MRRYQQKQLLELLKTIEQAQSEGLYGDCQAGALSIGEFIESIEGEGTQTVKLLEEYCELLFKVNSGVIRPEHLRKALMKIEQSIRYDFEIRFEIVFLPYKSSMWDSFEYVWHAANNDPKCDAYVVPIPYYDKKPGGGFKQMHYEGHEYPDYVPVVDWQSYDLKTRRPDAIFIHNLYDNYNDITSVHPNYYSKKLKSCTDCLIYIDYGLPYWIPLIPEKGHFLPAHILCDVFVTHSKEDVQKVRFMLELAVSAGALSRRGAEKKTVVALGMSKFDGIINKTCEDFILPEEWQKLIKGKKVMLFSTSIKAILKENEDFVGRIRSVFEKFRNRDDIVLWWRPHPLSESTFSSMRPQFSEDYSKLVNDYISGNWGIYDDTPDFQRAVILSDACYTDESSLVFLYLATGKPFSIRWPNGFKKYVREDSEDFTPILERRINNMQSARGANVLKRNCLIWWHNFADADFVGKVNYDNFLERFIHFVVNESEYPDGALYRRLTLEMFRDVVENPDGTAGQKIYEFIKRRILR